MVVTEFLKNYLGQGQMSSPGILWRVLSGAWSTKDSVGEGEGGMFQENSIETCILSRVKQITSPGWMHETTAWTWCTGKSQGIGSRGRWEGGSGWGTHVNPWLIHVSVWQKPLQYCKVISFQLIKINEKKIKVTTEIRKNKIKFANFKDLPRLAHYRKGRGTRDQIANICCIIEKAREFQKSIYFYFIDYAKVFDCVDHNKLWKILQEMGIPHYLTCLLRNLYASQDATVRTGHGTTDWFQIGKGVH